jgi:uncharacterized SAM-binding protein YcdF (DUF218 family)
MKSKISSKIFKLLLICSVFVLTWIIGLVIFIHSIPNKKDPVNLESTDAIVVLTGGSMRIEEGFNIFYASDARKILVSGVGSGVKVSDLKKIIKKIGQEAKIDQEKIVLGSIAKNTASNAQETKIFMNLNSFKSLRLVTSNYHIKRSLLIFKSELPGIRIVPHPVCSENFKKNKQDSIILAINEYNKLIGTLLIILESKYDKFILKLAKHYQGVGS